MVDKKNKLGSDFEKVRAKNSKKPELEHAFTMAAGRSAKKALATFNNAAERLTKEEAKFKARPRWEKLSLTHYLRSPEHMKALKDFAERKETLLSVEPALAKPLVRQAEARFIRPSL